MEQTFTRKNLSLKETNDVAHGPNPFGASCAHRASKNPSTSRPRLCAARGLSASKRRVINSFTSRVYAKWTSFLLSKARWWKKISRFFIPGRRFINWLLTVERRDDNENNITCTLPIWSTNCLTFLSEIKSDYGLWSFCWDRYSSRVKRPDGFCCASSLRLYYLSYICLVRTWKAFKVVLACSSSSIDTVRQRVFCRNLVYGT